MRMIRDRIGHNDTSTKEVRHSASCPLSPSFFQSWWCKCTELSYLHVDRPQLVPSTASFGVHGEIVQSPARADSRNAVVLLVGGHLVGLGLMQSRDLCFARAGVAIVFVKCDGNRVVGLTETV